MRRIIVRSSRRPPGISHLAATIAWALVGGAIWYLIFWIILAVGK